MAFSSAAGFLSRVLRRFSGTTTVLRRTTPAAVPAARDGELRGLVEALPHMAWLAATDGAIEYFNASWLTYTGIAVDNLQHAGVKGVVHPDELALTWELWREALRSGKPYAIEYRLRSAADGTYRWFLGRAAPVLGDDGRILRWIGTATDIDNQKRVNDNLRYVLDASSALSASLDVSAVCDAFANLSVNRVADWCVVALQDDHGGYRTVSLAHRDPDRLRDVEHFRDRYPVQFGNEIEAAIQSSISLLAPAIDEEHVPSGVRDDKSWTSTALLKQSRMVVPLRTESGETYGAIALVTSESERSYTGEDLEVAEMVARRAAAAIQTAMVFEKERRSSHRLGLFTQASDMIFASFEVARTEDELAAFLVEELADFAAIMRIEDGEALRTVSVAHRDPAKAEFAGHFRGQRTMRPQAEERAIRILSQHRSIVATEVDLAALAEDAWEYLLPDFRTIGVHSVLTVPLYLRGETYGALAVCWTEYNRRFEESELPLFEDLGRRLSMAIDHATTLERERRIASELQRALLPQPNMLPAAQGLAFASEYRPSSHEADVGGDWYDALELADGSIVVSVGDVTGRGLQAAGLMGKLRQAMGVVPLYEPDPARILDAVDYLLRARGSAAIATAFLGIIDPARRTIRFAGAGHPAPLLRRRDGVVELRSRGLPLGLRDSADREQTQEASLVDAEMLVLYTDGLTESTRDLAFGERNLHHAATSDALLFVRNPARFLCDACLPFDAKDDTAVLTVSFVTHAHWAFDAENAKAAHEARHEFVRYLRRRARKDSNFQAAEIVFGELIGNVVRHAPGPIDVQVDWAGESPVLHVIDRGRGFIRNPALPDNPMSESGRGLYIVSRLATDLRVERVGGYGNHVAAQLPILRRDV